MITGNCLCGAVSWQVDSELDSMSHCHCSMCRKAHGAPFATYVMAPRDSFHWVSGEGDIATYESSPGFIRAFCGQCGSVVPLVDEDDTVAMPAGCLNGDLGVRATSHIFATSKAPWHIVADDFDRFDSYPVPDDGPNIDRPATGDAKDGVLHGSCLCGDVAYEVTTPIKAVYNCHCSRCRKARAAAHTTNGFTAADGVTFVRGEDKLVTYKLQPAKHFSQVFCSRCGSPMPRLNKERNIAVIPFGSLDDDPGRGADCHIFTDSMATWYTITDDLPQFVKMPD